MSNEASCSPCRSTPFLMLIAGGMYAVGDSSPIFRFAFRKLATQRFLCVGASLLSLFRSGVLVPPSSLSAAQVCRCVGASLLPVCRPGGGLRAHGCERFTVVCA
ncbi:unnamed protein product [Vitrella brassicaformis CCMP3155]|uniref:Uncharacterized protein n=1 Tax=Vitrella brassicaformis (strain CCMP3155) TaxID=1169540 RepID=A0A0G4GRI8_VITBC|nr:unnamed protein product [Vitrella brassicaformis CCMP3155]|eukprot:CEM33180.1 unnamed protein product [Vitrella brassicaformis CCMP3155]